MTPNITLLGQMLSFALLVWFTVKFIWPPLIKAIEERQQKIAEGLAAADRSQKDLAQAQAEAEITAAANRAKEDLRKQVSMLAVTGAEKLLKREIDANAHKALIDDLAAQL